MRKHLLLSCLMVVMVLSFINCASGPQLSPMQVRELTTKLFESDYETVFRLL